MLSLRFVSNIGNTGKDQDLATYTVAFYHRVATTQIITKHVYVRDFCARESISTFVPIAIRFLVRRASEQCVV